MRIPENYHTQDESLVTGSKDKRVHQKAHSMPSVAEGMESRVIGTRL